jgi:hypothetical protein
MPPSPALATAISRIRRLFPAAASMTEYETQLRQDDRAEPLSPELALVDPELARAARALLPDVGGTGRTSDAREAAPQDGEEPSATAAATDVPARTEPSLRQRLLDAGADPQVLGPPGPYAEVDDSSTLAEKHPRSRRRSWRRRLVALTLLALVGAAVAFLVFDPQSDGTGAGLLNPPAAPDEAGRAPAPPTDTDTPGRATPRPAGGRAPRRSSTSRHTPTNPPPAGAAATTRTFVWPPVPRARFYRVEFFTRGRKIFEASPRRPRLTLPLRWRYRGRRFRLARGTYRWRVRPAFGRSSPRFGAPITRSIWVVR